MSKIKNGGLDQHGVEPFEQQQFGTAGVEGVKCAHLCVAATEKCRFTALSGYDTATCDNDDDSVIFVMIHFLVLGLVLVFIIFFVLVLVFVNEFIIFSFFAIFVFVFVNENYTG